MLSKEQKKEYRSDLFRHLDGIAVSPVAHALHHSGVCKFLLENETVNLNTLREKFSANEGYLNVALRILASQGWLAYSVNNDEEEISVRTNSSSALAFKHFDLYNDVVELIKFGERFHPRKFELEPFRKLEKIFKKYQAGYSIDLSAYAEDERLVITQILKHIEGILVGPTVVLLGMGGMFHKYFMEAYFRPDEYHKYPEEFAKILDFLSHLGWFKKKKESYQFTDKGLFYARRSSAYGVTVSYMPTFRKLDDLIFGNPEILRITSPGEKEMHVDRAMNVWGSGGAHAAYFKK